MEKQGDQRIKSLDLLRIISMLMVVILHFDSHGGVLSAFESTDMNYFLVRGLEYASVVCVNEFVLISGYFLACHTFKLKRVLSIVVEVLFYSWLFEILMLLVHREPFSLDGIVKAALPVSLKQYWFATAYIGLYLLMPIINKLIARLNPREYKRILVYLFIVLCIWKAVVPISDVFNLNHGYSVAWFVFLYLYAGYCRLHGTLLAEASKYTYLAVYFVCVVLMFAVSVGWDLLQTRIPLRVNYDIAGTWTHYTSPLNFIGAASLFHCFRKMQVRNKACLKAISFIAPLTFGVYLISDHPAFRGVIYDVIFKTRSIPSSWYTVILVFGMEIMTFFACVFMDYIRTFLFAWQKGEKYNRFMEGVQGKLAGMLSLDFMKGRRSK